MVEGEGPKRELGRWQPPPLLGTLGAAASQHEEYSAANDRNQCQIAKSL